MVITDLPSFLDNLDWTKLFGGNVTNLTSTLDKLNWTALFNRNITSLADSLNITTIFGFNVTDIDSLLNFNLTSLLNKWNITSVFGVNITNLTSLFDFNLTSLVKSWNLTSLIGGFNWTSIFGGKNATDSGAGKETGSDTGKDNTGFDWKSIFGGKDSEAGSIIDNIFNWITGKNQNNNTDNGKTSDKTNTVAKDAIKSSNLKTYYTKSTAFKVTVMSGNKPVTKGKVVFVIKNKKYSVNIGKNGVAILKLFYAQQIKNGTELILKRFFV